MTDKRDGLPNAKNTTGVKKNEQLYNQLISKNESLVPRRKIQVL